LAASFDDSSSGDHTITANGDTYNQRPQPHDVTANGAAHLVGPKVGTSVAHFDGGGDYITAAASSDFDWGSGDFTVEGWFNVTAYDAHGWGLWGNRPSSPTSGWLWEWGVDVMYFYYHDGSSQVNKNWDWTADTDRWYHLAVVRSSNTLNFYVDGVGQGSQAITDTITAGTTLFYGYQVGSSNYDFNGYNGPQRLSNTARYTADFTPPDDVWTNDSDTKLLIQNGTDGSQTFDDLSTGDHTISVTGDVRWFAPKVGAGAMAFDGDEDFLTLSSSAGNAMIGGTGSWTIEGWLNWDGSGGAIFMEQGNSAERALQIWIQPDGDIQVYLSDTDGSFPFNEVSGTTLTAHTWTHIALVKNGSAITLYKDGARDSVIDGSVTQAEINNSGYIFHIGIYRSAAGAYSSDWPGYMDQVRISRVVRYTGASFTAPTTAFTDDINTVLLLNADQNQGTWFENQATGLAISTDSRMDFDGTGDYLSIPDSSDWDLGAGDFTVEGWIRASTTGEQTIFGTEVDTGTAGRWAFHLGSANKLEFFVRGQADPLVESTAVLSIGAWYHVAAERSSGTITLYINGSVDGTVSNTTSLVAGGLVIGCWYTGGTSSLLTGYLDELRISDTARYDGAFTPQTRGNPFVSDSNTKLLIHSDYTGGLGADSSGNYNYFTPTNLVATDKTPDTPTNNFATISPLYNGNFTYSEGNLKIDGPQGSTGVAYSTISENSGKWYFEMLYSGDTKWRAGIAPINQASDGVAANIGALIEPNTWIYNFFTGASAQDISGTTISTDDVIGVAFNMDDNEVYFYASNAQVGSTSSLGTPTTPWGAFFMNYSTSGDADPTYRVNFGQDSSFAGVKTAQGNQDSNEKGDFYYAPPTDYLALCTDNLSAPEIALPGKNFNTVLYTGDGATTLAVTGVGFQPDMTWVKNRDAADNHTLVDSVRGATNYLVPNYGNEETSDQVNDATFVASLDSDGFTVGNDVVVNTNTEDYVSWNWKAGGAAVSNGDGDITASVSANTTAGFSIGTYTGNGTAVQTIGHGLSEAPNLVIVKKIVKSSAPIYSGYNDWCVGSDKGMEFTDYLVLNSAGAETDDDSIWNDTAPTSSVFTVDTNNNVNTENSVYVFYCFHSAEGYSKVGSYETNNNINGPFIYTGFKPAYLLVKNIDSVTNWNIWDNKRDTYNIEKHMIAADINSTEYTNSPEVDFVSNGFKVRSTSGDMNNTAGETAIFLAFSSSPFKYSNAR